MHKFYSAFGVLTVSFSKMEAEVRVLISGMAFKGEDVVASAFMDRSQLGENIEILRKLGRQHWDAHVMITSIAKRLEKLKPTRNLFIHGLWSPGTFGEPGGSATVQDLRTTFEDGSAMRNWRHGQTARYALAQFQRILQDVNAVRTEIHKLMSHLEKHEEMEFGWGGVTAISKPVIVKIDDNA